MDRPNPSARPQRSQLKLWRSLKLAEIWKALKELGSDAPKGTSQRKVRWRRGEQLAAAKRSRTKRRHARRRLTKKLQHNRAAKGQNLRTARRLNAAAAIREALEQYGSIVRSAHETASNS